MLKISLSFYRSFKRSTKMKRCGLFYECIMGVRGRQKNSSRRSLSGIKRLAKWCQTMILKDGHFDLPLTLERLFFLHTLYHFWMWIVNLMLLITLLWHLMTALSSVITIRCTRILNFYLTLDNFHLLFVSLNMRFFSMFLREPVFGPFYHMNSFRHSRQVYLVHSGWQNEGQKVIIKITDCMFFNLLMGTWFSMQRQEWGGGGVGGGVEL